MVSSLAHLVALALLVLLRTSTSLAPIRLSGRAPSRLARNRDAPARYTRYDHKLFAELRILIHGTKNAYTTLRQDDVVLFVMEAPVAEQTLALGVFQSDMTILPLCTDQPGSERFFIDSVAPLSAEDLKQQGRLKRIISSDRRGGSFVVEEWIPSDVYIPLQTAALPKPSPAPTPIAITLAPVSTAGAGTVGTVGTVGTEGTVGTVGTEGTVGTVGTEGTLGTVGLGSTGGAVGAEEELLRAEIGLAELKLRLLRLQSRGRVVHSDRAPRAVGPYSQAVKLPTGLVFLSGSVGLDPATGSLVPGGVEAQALQALQNMHAIVQAAGGGLGSVVKTLVLLADMGDYAKVNKVYADFFAQQGVASFPARSAFAVSALPLGALVEIEAVAAL